MEAPFELADVLEYNGTLWVNEEDPVQLAWVQALLGLLYGAIFVVGVTGNLLVLVVVARARPAHTLTNLFIGNLALSDLMLCLLCVPFTPLYTFMGRWVFGAFLCRVVVLAQGTSVYVSSLSLAVVAADRYVAVTQPLRARPRGACCLLAVAAVWLCACAGALPYALHVQHRPADGACEEHWPSARARATFGAATFCAQLAVPLAVAAFCYGRVWLRLRARERDRRAASAASPPVAVREAARARARRTLRLLVAVVAVFAACWLPLALLNLAADLSARATRWRFFHLGFFVAHVLATSSACYNPFLYAWLNDNFRREFRRLLPCCCGGVGAGGAHADDVVAGACDPGQSAQTLLPESDVGVVAVPVVSYCASGEVVHFSTVENLLDLSPSI
ncbi:prolactin-releasing peptide receptor-like [Schistocerca serialis cubense]|uniref:prolactin-releasing peptide receptor-like n=1 Tax=Schistocerca serialis cubense TaxID=2023355 RepID=UPI00214E79C0|nr:prolactin-releasing peptide receptor-like [Schistocerca serialis cubense]